MSRGERAAVTGIMSSSMRNNYGEYGVEEYYRKVGSTYSNPHYPGIKLCMYAWLKTWWTMESTEFTPNDERKVLLFDMACGSGEVTIAFKDWYSSCKTYTINNQNGSLNPTPPLPLSRSRKHLQYIIPLGPNFPPPLVVAADPFTSVAYTNRISLPCAPLSFNDISEGQLPPFVSDLTKVQDQVPSTNPNASSIHIHIPPLNRDQDSSETDGGFDDGKEIYPDGQQFTSITLGTKLKLQRTAELDQESYSAIEMVVCSFALHLIDNPSALFSLLSTLSYNARWLVVLAPHKKPEIKDGWGWQKWDVDEWKVSISPSTHQGEFLFDRVHCRVYRSANL